MDSSILRGPMGRSLRPLTPPERSAWVGRRAHPRKAACLRACASFDRGFQGAGLAPGGLFPPAPSGPLAETTSSARLETRTKESSVRASERVPNPSSAGKPSGANPSGRSIGRWGWPRPPPSAHQHARWDPKDGELCLSRAKPEETLVEARRCADVQIAFQTWA